MVCSASAGAGSVNCTGTPPAPISYAVTVNGSYAATSGAGRYAEGADVTIAAGTRSNYTFTGWTVNSDGVTLANARSTTTTFTMPDNDVTVSANWTPAGGGGGGSTATAVTVKLSNNEGSVQTTARVSGDTATIEVTDDQLAEIISGQANTGTVSLDLSQLDVSEAVIPQSLVAAIAEAFGGGLAVILPSGTVTLDDTAVNAVSRQDGELRVEIAEIKSISLSDEQRNVLGTQASSVLVVDANIYVDGEKISSFNGGQIKFSIPYTLKDNETAASLTVWFLADDGSIQPMQGVYNSSTGCVEFFTDHLSRYAVVSFPFVDVAESAWYYADVAYAYMNELFTGVSANSFTPHGTTTRAMLVTVLWRMEGSPILADYDSGFTDLTQSWYFDAVNWASQTGIAEGYGNDVFGSDDPVTREQLAAFLYRYAKSKGEGFAGAWMFPLDHPDADAVSDWSYEAMCWMTMHGIIQGRDDGTLDPQGEASRAELAAMLHRFMER
ncbi:MAG: S-layer homology domain-containing protein [Bacillota bacterium]|nr:S-layer homology domain-containing protein [Bacillota bacterium]